METFSSRQHLFAELERLDRLIEVQVWRARQVPALADDLRPYYISEPEVDVLLERPNGAQPWSVIPLPEGMRQELKAELDRMEAAIARSKEIGRRQGIIYRLDELSRLFQLTPFDLDTILVCLAPEVDQRYTRLYAYLQDDLSKPAPTVGMLVNMMCTSHAERFEAWQRLGPQAPLRRHQLLGFLPTSLDQPFSGRTLRLDERIRRYLLDDDSLDQSLDLVAELYAESGAGLLAERLSGQILRTFSLETGSQVFYFYGPLGVGKLAAAQALSHTSSGRLLVVRGQRLLELPLKAFSDLAQRAIREARLQTALLYWGDFDLLLEDEQSARRQILFDLLREAVHSGPLCVVLAGERIWDAGDAFALAGVPERIPFTRLPFHLPDSAQRLDLWQACLAGKVDERVLGQVAAQFRLSAGQIRSAAEAARNLAYTRHPQQPEIMISDLLIACRLQSGHKLASLAQKVNTINAWEELILPEEQMVQLHALNDQVRYRNRVLEEWGFSEKLALGKGLHALFTGPPGTGKSMAAGVLAGALDLDLYKIDLSTIVSKYIGETEKNLARIFAEASASNAILFFDEADALFGRRTEVKDSHDRYANLEVSYLLQKMDEYDGLVILASNLRQNIDKAFLRRLNFIIDFPAPGPADRLRIWQGIWPVAAPRAADVDLPALAEQLELTGGSIRNIVLSAAYLAASEGKSIQMEHLRCAAEGEYKKIGKLPAGSAQLTSNGRS